MTDQLPEVQVPDGASRFNVPAGAGFVAWFAALRVSINVLGLEILNRAIAAIPPAVRVEIAALGVLTGVKSTGADVALAFTDANGRRAWLEIGSSGEVTGYTATAMARAAAPVLLSENLVPLPKEISEGAGYSYVITDGAGRMSELRLDMEGRFTGPFPDRVIAAAVAATGSASGLVAKLPIASWSDSMGAAGSGYADFLATETGVECRIYGIGGQGTSSIAARQGGSPATAKFPNDTIPASGPVTLESISTAVYTSPAGTGTSSGHVSIAGVAGTLTRDNPTNTHTFTRDTPGAAAWVPPTTPIITDEAALNRSQVTLIWAGRNGVLTETADSIVATIAQMVAYMIPAEKRFLVLEVTPINTETSNPPTANRAKVDALNDALRRKFPHNYLPVSQYMRGPALADAGIAPTAQDQADFAAGVVPTSLMGDTVHFNAAGCQLVARLIAKHLRLKGWIP